MSGRMGGRIDGQTSSEMRRRHAGRAPSDGASPFRSLESHPGHPHRPRWLPWLIGLAVAAALLGVFALYRQPDFMVDVANQLWACF